MKKGSSLLVFLAIALGIWSCKTQRATGSIQKPVTPIDSLTLPQEPPIYITSTGDTLLSLEEEVAIELSPVHPDTFSLVAVGDIMMGTNFPRASYLPADSGKWLWTDVKPYLQDADLTFGNLEGVILDEGGDAKKCQNPKACYLFRTPEYLTYHFSASSFDIMSLANNHANDFGTIGRINTQETLDSLGIAHAGAIEKPFSSISRKRLSIGVVAVSPNRGTFVIHQLDKIKEVVKQLDSLHDMVIVSFHAGAEGSKNTHVTRKREYYYGEDRGNVYSFAHSMIDAGADILLGHGPHVPRAVEVYKNKFIAYSLGNFLTYGRFNLRGVTGEAPLLKIKVDKEGSFLSGEIVSFYQDYDLGPRLDSKLRALKSIKALSAEDFPENPVEVDDTGRIIYIQD